MSIGDDVTAVLVCLANWQEGGNDPNRGRYSVAGQELAGRLGLSAARVSDAVDLLESNRYVKAIRVMGTAPFSFREVETNARGRAEAERVVQEDGYKMPDTTQLSPVQLRAFIERLENVRLRAEKDEASKNWGTYDVLVAEYQAVRAELLRAGVGPESLPEIVTVPPGQRGAIVAGGPPVIGRGTGAEKAIYSTLQLRIPPVLTFLRSMEKAAPQTNGSIGGEDSGSSTALKVFISHSAKDAEIASAVVDLLRSALDLKAEEIRCSSVDGYRLRIGAETDSEVRREVLSAQAFIGLISPNAITSAYVMFELGARWGTYKTLAPLLAPGVAPDVLEAPLSNLNVLSADKPGQVHQLVSDLGAVLGITPESPAVYQKHVERLVGHPQGQEQGASAAPPKKSELEETIAMVLNLFRQFQIGKGEVLPLQSADAIRFRWDRLHQDRYQAAIEKLGKDGLIQFERMGIRLTAAGYEAAYVERD